VTALNILVTGASGLVGAEVVARLARDGHTVFALTHSTPTILRNSGRQLGTVSVEDRQPGSVVCLKGDITQPRLGMSTQQYEMLGRTLDRIVHSAALTDFGFDWDTYELLNVTGTQNVLELAQDSRRGPLPLVHLSTAYVCGERAGTIGEDELAVGQTFGTLYEKSKFHAEVAVRRAAAKGVPTAVVRPSIVVGAERTGTIRDFKNIYVVLKMFTDGRVRSVPGFYDAVLDLVPVDYVAGLVSQVATRFEEAAGKTFHAVGSGQHTLLDFSNVLAEYPSFRVPRYVPPASFSPERLPFGERAYYERVVGLYESFFRRRATFDDGTARQFADRMPTVHGHAYLRRLLNYCLRVGYLGARMPGIDDVLCQLAK
jgi:thioester reductase-like protein